MNPNPAADGSRSSRPIGDARDLLGALLAGEGDSLARWRGVLNASKGRGDRGLVSRAETFVQKAPERAFSFDATGCATLEFEGTRFQAGRFSTRSIGDLRRTVEASSSHGTVRLQVVLGESILTDIGSLQAWAAAGTLFQVASQFNCLESPGPYLVPVSGYFHDPTQGPRASVSAFPGTLLRHYAAPDPNGGRFTQDDAAQINLLRDVLPAQAGQVRSGYLSASGVMDPAGVAKALEERFELIQVGVHAEAEVVFGSAWDGAVEPGQSIAQVFTSTFAAGGYSPGIAMTGDFQIICRQLLRAAYLGTLLAAAALRRDRVVLTLIGGGVFGNPHPLIWESICWAVDEVAQLGAGPLEVVVNARSVAPEVIASMRRETARRGGRVLSAVF